ncbi:MAG: hypothetical protein ACRDX9_17160 [Acidimicrobiia bacterium]
MRSRLLALTLLLIVACSTQATPGDGYVLSEWEIDGPDRLTAGTSSLTVENAGEWGHTLIVTTDGGEVVGATGLVDSGTATTLELDLAAGTYTFSCRIVAEDDEGNLSDHYEQGMYRTVVVAER